MKQDVSKVRDCKGRVWTAESARGSRGFVNWTYTDPSTGKTYRLPWETLKGLLGPLEEVKS
jgi:hypothetical protein